MKKGRALSSLDENQIRVFLLTWISYAALYLTRKNFSVVKSDLHINAGISVEALGTIDTFYLSTYALGQFFSGYIGDRIGAKKIIVLGLLGSAFSSSILGYSQSSAWFICFLSINGLFQSTGWAGNMKALEPWFNADNRGKILGVWGTNQQVGGLFATVLAACMLSHFGLRYAFLIPSFLVALIGMLVIFLLVDPGSSAMTKKPSTWISSKELGQGYRRIIQDPYLWCLSLSYCGQKMIRYSLLFWLPFYLHNELDIDMGVAGYLSVSFELGGIIGSIFIGYIADRYFKNTEVRLIIPVVILLAGTLYIYREFGSLSIVLNCSILALCGVFVCGPDALISGACAQNLGREQFTGSVAGFINGMGSIGAILQGLVTAYVSSIWGWPAVFHLFFIIAFGSALVLVPFFGRSKEGREQADLPLQPFGV